MFAINLENKQRLLTTCLEQIVHKIGQFEKAIADAQQAANQETKSSAGDKHETGRAMMQLEVEKLSQQLAEVLKMKQQLEQIDLYRPFDSVQAGTLTATSQGIFFIASSIGKLKVEDTQIFVISAASPMGQTLLGARLHETRSFRNQQIRILEIS